MIRFRQVPLRRPVARSGRSGTVLPRLLCVMVIGVAAALLFLYSSAEPEMFTAETGEIPDALVNGSTPMPVPPPLPAPEKKAKPPQKPAWSGPEKGKARKEAAHQPKKKPKKQAMQEAASPPPEPAPALSPAPAPASPPVPASAPADLPPLDAATVAQRPELWPKEVMLTRATRLPIFFEGKVVGEAEAPAGLWLPLSSVSRDGDRVVVLYSKSKIPLHVSATNLLELARQREEQLRAAPPPTPPPAPPEAPGEAPLPEAPTAGEQSPELPEIPGLSPRDETPAPAEAPPATPASSPGADEAPAWILRRPTEPLPEAGASPTPRPGW